MSRKNRKHIEWEPILKDLISRKILIPEEYQHILDVLYGR